MYDWFQAHGVPLKDASGLARVPASDDGPDIVGVFRKMFAQSNVKT